MPSPNLPIELWLEILSYLPRTAWRKLIGINRTLFGLALDAIYEECYLISNDEKTSRLLTRIKHPDIAKRVRHFYIRPDFLPQDESKQKQSFRSKLTRKTFRLKMAINSKYLWDQPYKTLRSWEEAIKCCRNVRELTVVLLDNGVIPTFIAFLDTIWNGDSMGSNFKRLSLNITPVNLSPLLKLSIKHPKVLPGFKEIVLDISESHCKHSTEAEAWSLATKDLRIFLQHYSSNLTFLSISSNIIQDLGKLFDDLPFFPNLKELEVLAVFNSITFSKRGSFTKFISIHSSTLEVLTVKGRPRTATLNSSGTAYALWLAQAPAGIEPICSFSQLVLPKLQTLTIGIENSIPYFIRFLPNLSSITPNLKRLTFSESSIKRTRLGQILDSLSLSDEENAIQELSYICDSICHATFDMLSSKLPRLKSLTIMYSCKPTGDVDNWSPLPDFCDMMQTRNYTTWPVRYLRLLRASGCGEGHPCESDMKIVASRISPDVIIDTAWKCTCTCTCADNF